MNKTFTTFKRTRQCPKCNGKIYKGWLYCRNNTLGIYPVNFDEDRKIRSLCGWKPR